MLFRASYFIILFLFPIIVVGQEGEEEPCPKIDNKEAKELFEKGTNRKKYDKYKRLKFLREAVENEEDYVDAHYILAVEIIRTAKYQGTSLLPAEEHLLKVVELCPNYHSNPHFWLGEINLYKEDYAQAMKYYKQFLKFQHEDKKKFSRSYEKNYEQAEEDYKYAKFYEETYKNPVPFDPKIVKEVSSDDDEYLPLITPDNEVMFFTRKFIFKPKVRVTSFESDKPIYIERFSQAKHLSGINFEKGEPMSMPFNKFDFYNYGGATVTIDNKHIYLTVCKPGKRGYKNCDIYVSHYVYEYNEREGKELWYWTELENLGDSINGEMSWEGQPSISADGNILYFASAREESRGIDIYKTEKDTDGNWRKAVNLGQPINTELHDKTPFVHSDSKTLYFASQGHLGFGGFDVFYSRQDDSGNWGEPKNIGHPINSREDEHGFVVSTDGKKVYLSSGILKELGGGLDIYSFDLYKEARPDEVMFLKGEVKDEHGEVVNDAEIELKYPATNEVQKIKIDLMDGKYAAVVNVKNTENLIMNIKAEGKTFNSRLITKEDTKETFVKMEIKLEDEQVGKPYRINEIYYEINSAEIKLQSKFILDEFIEYLDENSTIKVAIHGHTDNVGTEEDNKHLSSDRAFSVMAYLQEKGIEKIRLSFMGFGESKPIATNDTDEGRALNRRTEFVILEK